MGVSDLISIVEGLPDLPGPHLWNVYRRSDSDYDVQGAERIRRENFASYVRALRAPKVLLCGEAPGVWGMRFAGIPFTSEHQIVNKIVPFVGQRTSTLPYLAREMSATIVWDALGSAWRKVVMWNTVPHLPFRPGEPLSMRTPTAGEVRNSLGVLQEVVDAVQPEVVVAVGRKAEGALQKLGVEHELVRHPARGGARLFTQQARKILGPWLEE